MWLIILLLAITGCSAQVTMEEAVYVNLPLEVAADGAGAGTTLCSTYSEMEPSVNLDIPESCCEFSTEECHFTYNGMCRLRWDTADCDYTVDVCQTEQSDYTANWFCTCCASCQGDTKSNDCTDNKGVCRRCCHDDEFSAFWHKCSNDNCMCCKKHCPSDTCMTGTGKCVHKSQDCPEGYSISDTDECEGIDCKCCKKNDCQGLCASGTGICMTNTESCPKGYYVSAYIDDDCKGINCQCCKPCRKDEKCTEKQGFCEWLKKDCPMNYVGDDCPCPDEECRCCRPAFIIDDDKVQSPGRAIVVKQKQEMVVEIPQNP